MTIPWYSLSSLFFYPLSLVSQPSCDLRQFAKQDALQHTAIPAHLDRAKKRTQTCIHALAHAHTLKTHVHESSFASLGCCNRILNPLMIISDVEHEWMMSTTLQLNMLQKPFSSCARKKILRDNRLWFGEADCVRNPFKIRNPYVRVHSMKETVRVSNTLKHSCKHVDRRTEKYCTYKYILNPLCSI